jgi:hypothetical protein
MEQLGLFEDIPVKEPELRSMFRYCLINGRAILFSAVDRGDGSEPFIQYVRWDDEERKKSSQEAIIAVEIECCEELDKVLDSGYEELEKIAFQNKEDLPYIPIF